MWNLDVLLTGGVGAAIVASVFELFHILMNKKVRSPADLASQRRADIVERNEMIDAAKKDTTSLKGEVEDLKAELKEQAKIHREEMATLRQTHREEFEEVKRENRQQETEIDALREEALARDHYIYKCLGTFHRLGMEEHIPKPTPFERQSTTKETENNG
jgi:septal ring factor EnvC (AmiA/AmiB activator)